MKAVTFGSAMIDIITVVNSQSIEQISLSNAHQQFLLVEPGSKVEAQSITRHIGGGALNTAVCLSKLGCQVAPAVMTGEDVARDHILHHCEKHSLSPENFLSDQNATTGSAVMIASHEKNAAIFTHRGANTMLEESDLKKISPLSADLVHAAPLSGDSAKMLPLISELALQSGAFFSSNPGIRQITTRANSVLSAARHMSLISINAMEAAALVPCLSALDDSLDWGKPNLDEPVLSCPGGIIPLKKFCEELHSKGPKNVLITYGGDGAYLYDGHALLHQPVIPVAVAGTAGAGDSFVSTLAFGLVSGLSPDKALLLAAHNASSVVSFVNTTDGLLDLEELKKRSDFNQI
ncbi:MAG: carbohydrate kinase family protein [Pseudomonadota bacterium]